MVGDGKYTETAGKEAAVDVKYMVINGKYVIVCSGGLVPATSVLKPSSQLERSVSLLVNENWSVWGNYERLEL